MVVPPLAATRQSAEKGGCASPSPPSDKHDHACCIESAWTCPRRNIHGLLMREANSRQRVIDRLAQEMQSAIMAVRLQPISEAFDRFPRLVRDFARKLSKKIDLQMEGEETSVPPCESRCYTLCAIASITRTASPQANPAKRTS